MNVCVCLCIELDAGTEIMVQVVAKRQNNRWRGLEVPAVYKIYSFFIVIISWYRIVLHALIYETPIKVNLAWSLWKPLKIHFFLISALIRDSRLLWNLNIKVWVHLQQEMFSSPLFSMIFWWNDFSRNKICKSESDISNMRFYIYNTLPLLHRFLCYTTQNDHLLHFTLWFVLIKTVPWYRPKNYLDSLA